ncbi:MAG: creatininase family protein [Gemmatimonadota bacterium]|jgi:creatinine amidohydrolase
MSLPPPFLERIPWTLVQDTLARDPRLLLAVGALEQAGPHLPLGTNLHIAGAVVDEVARRTGILRAPAFPYGVTLKGSSEFSGTAGLRRKTLHRAINELLADWEDHGVREFILVTAHPSPRHLEALLMALTADAVTTVFDLPTIDIRDLVEGEPGLEHGGEVETSLLLHLLPEVVSMDDARDLSPTPAATRSYRRGHPLTPPLQARGVMGFPSRASREKGEAIFLRYASTLTELLERDRGSQPNEAG